MLEGSAGEDSTSGAAVWLLLLLRFSLLPEMLWLVVFTDATEVLFAADTEPAPCDEDDDDCEDAFDGDCSN